MPIYEYQCSECSHRLEKLQKISDDPLVDCPECGRPALTKLVSAAGFRLKGGGWYETDFKDKRKRNLAGDSDAGAGDGKSDAKDDAKGDGKKGDGKKGDKSSSGDGTSDSKNSGSKKAEKSAPSTAV